MSDHIKTQVLLEAAAKFRFYAREHAAKTDRFTNSANDATDTAIRSRAFTEARNSDQKARANAEMAERCERAARGEDPNAIVAAAEQRTHGEHSAVDDQAPDMVTEARRTGHRLRKALAMGLGPMLDDPDAQALRHRLMHGEPEKGQPVPIEAVYRAMLEFADDKS